MTSTLIELVGFSCIASSAWLWQTVRLATVTGLIVTGLLLLLVGYATDDKAAAVSLHRLTLPVRHRWRGVQARRELRRRRKDG